MLVTGAAGGIGRAIVQRLVRDGRAVIATDLAAEPSADGPRAASPTRWVKARLPDEAERLVAALPARLSGLVHAIGVVATHAADDFDGAVFTRLFETNVQTPIAVTAALAGRLQAGASVVFIGSVAGVRPSPANLLYGASKAALHSAAASFAAAFAPRGVRVNTVCPGLIDTALSTTTDRALAELCGATVERVRASRREKIPLGRAGTPEEVAGAVAFLMSEEAAYVTGERIMVAGGAG